VTSSQDRNAYVWTWKENAWKPTLVILRINRAATSVKWSPLENKFAVSSGAKCVSICYFEEDNDWWISKHIKKHKSTVLSVHWHPNNVLIATASSDFKCRIFSAFIKQGVDKKPAEPTFGNNLTFGEMLAEFDQSAGWVHACAFSPSGRRLAFVGHDSSFSVADLSNGTSATTQTLKLSDLPLVALIWINENNVVAVGHDCNPFHFTANASGQWAFTAKVDKKAAGGVQKSSSAMSVFKDKVNLGTSGGENDTVLDTKHQNCITWIAAYKAAGANVTQYSTSGLDGKLILWDHK